MHWIVKQFTFDLVLQHEDNKILVKFGFIKVKIYKFEDTYSALDLGLTIVKHCSIKSTIGSSPSTS